ncbi:anti-sigma factor [Frigidibacter sp. MR17.14]|uniref:anti-sigma factor n=1 Tax=Frigidibacter sp. MR17.14 TaxID=3126509 RepID=UPI003012EED8
MTGADEHDLAADYVLGLASAEDRARAEDLLQRNGDFARQVQVWQQRLSGLDAEFVAVEPPAHLLGRTEERIFGPAPRTGGVWWQRWSFGAGLTAAALAVLTAVWFWPGQDLRPIAELSAPDLAISVLADAEGLTFSSTSGPAPNAQSYQLWVIRAGQPHSLGLLTGAETTVTQRLERGDVLAVSLEPSGGSPTGLPTGPVLATASIADL